MRRGLALVMMCGCSFALVHGPKPAPAPTSDCTQSRVVPIIDTVVAGVAALFAVYAMAASTNEWHDVNCDVGDTSCTAPNQSVTAVVGSIIAVGDGLGAYWGYTRVSQCRRAQGEAPFVRDVPPPVVTPPPPPPPPDAGEGSGDTPPIPPSGLPVPGAS
jgi:hypothetical protein